MQYFFYYSKFFMELQYQKGTEGKEYVSSRKVFCFHKRKTFYEQNRNISEVYLLQRQKATDFLE